MKKIPTLMTALSIFLLSGPCKTMATAEQPATPEIFLQTDAKLLISEVNFKNKRNDWLKIYYESPAHPALNLKGFQFQDDTTFKKITNDAFISSGEYYELKFKSTDPDDPQNRNISTTHAGLTATTEQIILKDPGGKIVDAVCWTNGKPTEDEIKDMAKLYQNKGWISADPESCFDSTKVAANQSIVRNGTTDTNTAADWVLGDGETGTVQTQETNPTKTTDGSSTSDTFDESGTSSEQTKAPEQSVPQQNTKNPVASEKNTNASKSGKRSTKTNKAVDKSSSAQSGKQSPSKKTKKYKTGDMSNDIIISEIFPHPSKDGRHNEWIELTNTGGKSINLGNWKLDDEEGGSKPYTLPDTLTVPPASAVVIKAPDSKLSLGNLKDAVRLFDPAGKMLLNIPYEEAPKDVSYALVKVRTENGTQDRWVWENTPTPGVPNPAYEEITGTVGTAPAFGQDYRFTMQTSAQKQLTVVFNESLIAGPLAKTTFQPGTQIKILGVAGSDAYGKTGGAETEEDTQQQDEKTADVILLKKFEVIKTPDPAADATAPWMLFGLVPPGGAGFWYSVKKFKKLYAKM